MCASIHEFGFKIPVLARTDGTVVDGHLRIKAARKLGSWPGGDMTGIPVILCDEWTDAQVKAFRLMVNRSVTWADWDEELLALELQELNELDFNLDLTGFNPGEIDGLLAIPDEERANEAPPLPAIPASHVGDLWVCGPHRILCGDATSAECVARLLGDRKPLLMVTDPPYGIELDSEWRDRAGLNTAPGQKRTKAMKHAAKNNPQYPAEASYMKHRTTGHVETSISGDTRADWSDAFALVPSRRSRTFGTPPSSRAKCSMGCCASASLASMLSLALREFRERTLAASLKREDGVLDKHLRQRRHQRLLAALIPLEYFPPECPLPVLGYPQHQFPHPRLQGPRVVPRPVSQSLRCALALLGSSISASSTCWTVCCTISRSQSTAAEYLFQVQLFRAILLLGHVVPPLPCLGAVWPSPEHHDPFLFHPT